MRFVERLLSEYVPWRDFIDDCVILNTDDSVFMVVSVDGLPFETTSDPIINHHFLSFEEVIRDTGEDGITFHFMQCRGIADPSLYPAGEFTSEFSQVVDAKYRHGLFGKRSMWLNRSYIAIQLSPRVITGTKTISRWWNKSDHTEPPVDRMRRLQRIVGQFVARMKDYNPRILGIVERNKRLFNEIAEAMDFAMTGYWRSVPLTLSADASSIFSEKFIIGKEAFEIRMPHASTFGACLDMSDFPYITGPGMLDSFLSASYRHTVYHSFRCLPATLGQELVLRKQNRMRHSGDRALAQAQELSDAANLIASGRMMMGDNAHGVLVFVDDPDSLTGAMQSAWRDFSVGGLKVERCDITLEGVLFACVIGNFHLRGRDAGISSRNFAAFASLHNFPTGERRKWHWGTAIAMFRTSGGTPYLMQLHSDGVGNCIVCGMVGSGKTTWLGLIMCQSQRAGAQIILWDKDRGLETLVRALHGAYLALVDTPDHGSGIAPLKRLGDNTEDLKFLASLIRACVSTPDPYKWTAEEDRRLNLALHAVMRLPSHDRWLEDVRAFLGTSRDGAGARLEKWCWGQEFGWIIDCPKDIVNLDNKVIGFDQSRLVTDAIAAGAIMATLFHYTGKLVDGRRLVFIVDEAWNAFDIEQFNDAIKNGLKTWRKYNSPVILGTQDPGDALRSPIGDTVRAQTPTQIFFSDPKASWGSYGDEGMKLTETEFDIVTRLPKGTGHFLFKQGEQSVVLHGSLADMDDEIAVISGTKTSVRQLDEARERTGLDVGPRLIEEFHRIRKAENA